MAEIPTASNLLGRRIAAIDDSGERVQAVVEGDELLMVQTGPDRAGLAMHPGEPLPSVVGDSAYEVARRGAATTEVTPRALGVAALNAIDPPPRVNAGLDPFRRLDPSVTRVAMVGLFAPVLKHLDAAHVDVFERNPETVTVPADRTAGLDVSLHSPEDAQAVLPQATVVFITGSTLVWGGVETYLQAATPNQTIVLVGASASFSPEPLFDAGVSMVAGASVEDPDSLERAISGDDSAADLHDSGLSKWAVRNPDLAALQGLELD